MKAAFFDGRSSMIITDSLDRIQQGFDAAYDKTTGSLKVQIHQ